MDSVVRQGATPWAIRLAGALCLGVAVVAPMAVGGFRAQWWLAFATILFAAAAFAALSIAVTGRQMRRLRRADPLIAPLYLAFILGLCLHVALLGGRVSDPDAAYGLLRQLSYAALAWTLLQAMTRERRAEDYATALICAALIYAVYGLITIERVDLLLFEKSAYSGVATGPFVNRNSFATFMAMGACLALACAMADETGLERRHRQSRRGGPLEGRMRAFMLFAVALLCIAAVYATASRMGLLVTLFGAMLVVVLRLRRLPPRAGRAGQIAALSALLAIAGLGAVTVLYGGDVADRLGSSADSASVRLALYTNVLEMIAAHPLLGVGLDNFGEAFRAYHRLPVSPDLSWHLAHNTYLALWSELGLVLGTLPMVLLLLASVTLLRRSLSGHVAPTSHLADAGLAAVVIAALHSLLDFSLEMPANAYLLVTLIVLGLGPVARQPQEGTSK
jgi:O-antigen ligase